MNCQNMDLIESLQSSFFKVQKVKFGCFATFCNFLKKRFDNFFIFCTQLLGDDIDQLSRNGFHCIIQKVIFKVGKVRFSLFSHNY